METSKQFGPQYNCKNSNVICEYYLDIVLVIPLLLLSNKRGIQWQNSIHSGQKQSTHTTDESRKSEIVSVELLAISILKLPRESDIKSNHYLEKCVLSRFLNLGIC